MPQPTLLPNPQLVSGNPTVFQFPQINLAQDLSMFNAEQCNNSTPTQGFPKMAPGSFLGLPYDPLNEGE